jgi:hypothetical protein
MRLEVQPAAAGVDDITRLHKLWSMMTSVVVSMMLAQDAQRRGDEAQRDFLIRAALEQARKIVDSMNDGPQPPLATSH